MKPIMKNPRDLPDRQYGDFRPWHMTSEDLYSKSDIAIQLAYRDKMIESLGQVIRRALASGQMEKLDTAKHLLDSFDAKSWPGSWPTEL